MKIILRSGSLIAAAGVGMSLVALPAGSADAAGATRVRCNDIAGLVDAIDEANADGGRITLASHCTYTLTAPDNADDGLPEITGNVTISGKDTTIRRDPAATENFRIFHVVAGGTLTLKSLTVSGGNLPTGSGGGIANERGTLNLKSTVVKGNLATNGGGLSNLAGQITLDRSTVERNTANGFGGGMLNDGNGTIAMKGGALRNNRAILSNGGGLENILGTATLESVSVKGNSGVVGGGLRNTNGSTLNLKSTTVRDNTAVSGAGLSNNASTATLIKSLVTRNTASTAGGGILNEADGQVTLIGTKVIRNTPDNCAPAGSVPGCTNPTTNVAPPPSQHSLPPGADDDVEEPK